MNHYLDIHVRPDPEFKETTLLGALVSKLHRRLVALSADDIGISLPDHEGHPPLGSRLRIHGQPDRLEALMAEDWLGGIRGHLDIKEVRAVPGDVRHRIVRRRQYKTSVERLRRRRMRRHDETYEQAYQHIPDSVERRVDTPFLCVQSSSSGRRFCLFIEHGPLQDQPQIGCFNAYGLSKEATIPWWS